LAHDRTHLPDVDQLRAAFPLWDIGSAWVTSASGPDFRLLTARRAGVRFAAFSAAELERVMTVVEDRYGWPRC
jgi:hypothetical protein